MSTFNGLRFLSVKFKDFFLLNSTAGHAHRQLLACFFPLCTCHRFLFVCFRFCCCLLLLLAYLVIFLLQIVHFIAILGTPPFQTLPGLVIVTCLFICLLTGWIILVNCISLYYSSEVPQEDTVLGMLYIHPEITV